MPSRQKLACATFIVISVITLFGSQACRSERTLPKAEPEQPIVRAKGEFKPLTLSVQFKGGTIEEYVETLKRGRDDINAVVDSGAGKVPMPSVSLEKASVGSALQLITLLAAAKDSKVIVQSILDTEPGNEVFVVGIDQYSQSKSDATTQLEKEIKNIKAELALLRQGVDKGKK